MLEISMKQPDDLCRKTFNFSYYLSVLNIYY